MRRATEIHTERLRMRRVRADDLDAIHGIMSDPETMRFWSSPPHATRDETERWLTSMIEAEPSGKSDEFILEHLGLVVGKLGAWRLPEIGFFVRRDCWGEGFATEALQRFISYAREQGVECLTADVDPRNAACLRLLAKCGFIETGRKSATYHVAGQPCDSVFLRYELQAPAPSEMGRDQ
jgi:RimJ/RimL family protein N-acetyltransferase